MQPKTLYDLGWQLHLRRKRTLDKYPPDITERLHELYQICQTHDKVDSSTGASSFFFMLDLNRMKFLYVSKGIRCITGYSVDEVLNGHFLFYYNAWHPQDVKILNSVHQKLLSFFYATPIQDRPKLKFCYNFRLRRKDGAYMHVLQQTIFMRVSDGGAPLVEFSNFTDITSFKKDHHLTLSIQRLNASGEYQEVYKEEFCNYDFAFTRRQLEIMSLISQGLTTKEIAANLCLSTDTVKNHRKNILKMTGSKNVVEVYRSMLNG